MTISEALIELQEDLIKMIGRYLHDQTRRSDGVAAMGSSVDTCNTSVQ